MDRNSLYQLGFKGGGGVCGSFQAAGVVEIMKGIPSTPCLPCCLLIYPGQCLSSWLLSLWLLLLRGDSVQVLSYALLRPGRHASHLSRAGCLGYQAAGSDPQPAGGPNDRRTPWALRLGGRPVGAAEPEPRVPRPGSRAAAPARLPARPAPGAVLPASPLRGRITRP